MSSNLKVNNIQNLAGDDSGIDLSTNDQIILKTANTTAVTVDASQNVTFASKLATTNLGTGAVLQVVQGGRTSRVTHNSQTLTDVGVSATITPSSTSSKILVRLEAIISNSNAGNITIVQLLRGDTPIGSGTGASGYNVLTASILGQNYSATGSSQSCLDSPATTSEITYKIRIAAFNGTGCLGGRGDSAVLATPTRLTLMEIAG